MVDIEVDPGVGVQSAWTLLVLLLKKLIQNLRVLLNPFLLLEC